MKKLDILYEDKYLIVISKEAKLLTISTNKEKDRTLYNEVSKYLKKQNKNNKVFIVHRLDKDTSGVIVFAKSYDIKRILQDNWNNVVREYTCVVEGKLEGSKTIKNYLYETKNHLVLSSNNSNKGVLAITEYYSIKSSNKYSLVKIIIKTGRKNQIRVHMSDLNHPIVGDKKYNAHTNPLNRLALHATSLTIIHPITNKEMQFTSKVPENFLTLIK